ncbi:MAG: VWA domain-containing protein [Chlorobiota bacterium]
MRIRYSQWTEQSETAEQQLQRLLRTFNFLLLQTSGDVEEALEILQELQRHYGELRSMTMDEFIQFLRSQGYIEEAESGKLIPTAKALQQLRREALQEIFRSLRKSDFGFHETVHSGEGIEQLPETRPYTFGDQPSNIDATETLTNALLRSSDLASFQLQQEDIRVHETEHLTSCATVLLIDVSHSMILYGEDRITPAKQVALALAELIRTRYPKDTLEVVIFGDEARRVSVADIPFITVGPFHTNTRDGLRLARALLSRCRDANKQIFMLTDGKPSAIFDENGRLYKNAFGLDPRIVNKTLEEAVACRRHGIVISTFMLARDPYLVNFVEELTRANRGRAFYCGLRRLGETVLVDYILNRRKTLRM